MLSHDQVTDTGDIASAVTTEDSSTKDDVTGGMKLKLSTAIAIQVGLQHMEGSRALST
jgi:isopentenyl phosphate kinase